MPSIEIESVDYDRRVNYARQQNDIPLIRSVTLTNSGESDAVDVQLRIAGDPDFARERTVRIDRIGAGARHEIKPLDVPLSPHYLSGLSERVSGQLLIEAAVGEQRQASFARGIEILAYDEWAGVGSIPELVAAFVFPNHPATEKLVRAASDVLKEVTGNGAMDGYQQRDRKRCWAIAASIYTAIVNMKLAYASPPASFEERGQKVRTPDRIESTRLATCLDVALLFCACLEQAGLNSLIVFQDGHAFPGVWLKDESFDVAASDDLIALRKHVDLHDVCVFESTLVTQAMTFAQAVRGARKHLDEEESFRLFIDMRRARHNRIRPLPLRGSPSEPAGDSDAESSIAPVEATAFDVPDLPAWDDELVSEAAAPKEESRLARWQSKLLDLSLRNRLLNFKETNKTLRLNVPNPAVLEDMIAGGQEFRVAPNEHLMGPNNERQRAVHTARTGEDALKSYLQDEMQAGRLHAPHEQRVLDRHLLEIYRASKEAENEGGANTLYLAIGFLSWIPQNRSDPCLAPLVLVPVELKRRSVRHGFSLHSHDDDTIANVSLLQLLERHYQLDLRHLETLPRDQSGVDIPRVLEIVERAVLGIPGWEVRKRVDLGLFSFSKYLMWKDLQDHTDLLVQNSIVDHLVNHPTEPFPSEGDFPAVRQLDQEHLPRDTFCPLIADSSQLAAVYSASDGNTFVMEGPPGTGKSQTIANIVSQCLATGKTVLFVSEKAAALNVVYERLDQVGLGPFCLELHSNKARKRQVVEQLARPLQLAGHFSADEWHREAARLAESRAYLNDYVNSLHHEHGNGLSLFKVISRLSGLRDTPTVDLSWSSLEAVESEKLTPLFELVDRLATAATVRAEAANSQLDAIGLTQWTPSLDREAATNLQALYKATVTLHEKARRLVQRLKLPEKGWSEPLLEQMNNLALLFLECPSPPAALVTHGDWQEVEAKLEEWINHGRKRDILKAQLLTEYGENLLDLDADLLSSAWNQARQSVFPKAWWLRRRVFKALRGARRSREKIAPEQAEGTLNRLREYKAEEQSLNACSEDARAVLGRFWHPGESNWDEIQTLRQWTTRLRASAVQLSNGDPAKAQTFREAWSALASEDKEALRPEGVIGREMLAYRQVWHALVEARQKLEAQLAIEPDALRSQEADCLGRLLDFYRALKPNLAHLREWSVWRRTRAEALKNQLGPLVAGFESGAFRHADLVRVFERSFYQWWFETAVAQAPVVRDFFGPEHDRQIKRFRGQDAAFEKLTQRYIVATLAGQVPRPIGEPNAGSEIGLLTHQLRKRRGHLPIRQLIQKIPNILPRLSPCVLMSPLSIAQYLPAGHAWFDVVIFDEASQIAPWDALGAIARGKSLVVAGDPKQMPPTNFFERVADDGDDVNPADITDMESILDECAAAGVPPLRLKWHYRSRHESLIAFSNYQYYHNRLLTFPSSRLTGMGVSFHHVKNGIYDRGNSRTNRGEAGSIVQEIVTRLSDPRRQNESIGVVTFNIQQQRLIEDLLEQARQANPAIDAHFAEEAREPVFVKNLENVQGDERDVMLFSICYGKDATGRPSVNFGPLNRDGGERRLNVAITRARKSLIVFSGIRYSDIDLNRSRKKGVADLRTFLEYAERGTSVLHSQLQADPAGQTESPLEDEVKNALLDQGWQVHSQVGCSGYRLDLAVIDPRSPGRYLAAVECDGATYHSASTARDRDRLRQLVLEGLGWHMLRVWSTDWWHDPSKEASRLQAALQALLEQPDSTDAEDLHIEPVAAEIEVADDADGNSNLTDESPVTRQSDSELFAGAANSAALVPPYSAHRFVQRHGDQAEFYEGSAGNTLCAQIQEVAEREGPILLPLLARRLAEAWGFQQVSRKVIGHVRDHLSQAQVRSTRSSSETVVWPPDEDPREYDGFRGPGITPASQRKPEEIPLCEIANAVRHVIESYISMSEEALLKETASLLGVRRLTARIRRRMVAAMGMVLQANDARQENGNIVRAR
jgi:very-short-patch-repair endonuclease